VQSQFVNTVVEQRISALKQAANYGQDGLELLVNGLKDNSEQVQKVAYQLLKPQNNNCAVKKAILEYNPYAFFECLHTIEARSNNIHTVVVSSDKKFLVSSSADTIKIWHPVTGKLLRSLNHHTQIVNCIAISADGKLLASGSDDCTIKLWHLHTGELLRTICARSSRVTAVAISPDGKIVASGNWDNIYLWNLQTGKRIHTLEDNSGSVDALNFSADGNKIITRSSKWIKVWGTR
jgi:COMPASS component SWD3